MGSSIRRGEGWEQDSSHLVVVPGTWELIKTVVASPSGPTGPARSVHAECARQTR